MEEKFVPSVTHYKVLITVYELNNINYYPLPKGVLNILLGLEDDETILFKNLKTYGTLISCGSKKIARLILMLVRYGYLKNIYDKDSDELYLKCTDFGSARAMQFLNKHKEPFKRKIKNKKPNFKYIK